MSETNKLTRAQVYDRIDREREYQERMWGPNGERRSPEPFVLAGSGPEHAVGSFIVFMDEYLNQAKVALTFSEGHHEALDRLRKVVALGVACFEQHGVPPRSARETYP